MIRLQPYKSQRIDPVEERRKARMAVVGNVAMFSFFVGVIRAAPFVIQYLKQ